MALHTYFERVDDQTDRVTVWVDDAAGRAWTAPTYGGTLPHDMVHLLVEGAFGLSNGFWGRVQGGADPVALNARAAAVRAQGRAAWGERREELLLAEALAAIHWFDPAIGDGPRLLLIEESCASFGVELPERFTLSHVAGATYALRLARELYTARPALGLGFCPEGALESFAGLLEILEGTAASPR